MVEFRSSYAAAGGCGAHLLVGFALLLWVGRVGAAAGEAEPGDLPGAVGTLGFGTPGSAGGTPPRVTGVDFLTLPHGLPLSADMLAIPKPYRTDGLSLSPPPPAREFRARARPGSGTDPAGEWMTDGRLLRSDDLGQRLAAFRSRGRVRVMTLWEAGGGSLSLQAGRRGDPSVQWTSRLSNHGEGARGLLDGLLNSSLGGLGKGLRWMSKLQKPSDLGAPPPPILTASAATSK